MKTFTLYNLISPKKFKRQGGKKRRTGEKE
jgi:hypothetical protein